MGIFYVTINEKVERTGGEVIRAETAEEAVKEVERRVNTNTLECDMQILSREVSYSISYGGGD